MGKNSWIKDVGRSGLARVGGVLPQPLAARQDRPQHARRQLYRRLYLADPRQGRHRHLGDAGAGLPRDRSQAAALRAARLPARNLLLLVPVQSAACEVSVHPRRADRPVAQGARRARRSRRCLEIPDQRSCRARALAAGPRQGWLSPRALGRGAGDHRRLDASTRSKSTDPIASPASHRSPRCRCSAMPRARACCS